MDPTNDDDEPKVCTVFGTSGGSSTRTIFDSIAFVSPKKEEKSFLPSTAELEIAGDGPSSALAEAFESTTTTQQQPQPSDTQVELQNSASSFTLIPAQDTSSLRDSVFQTIVPGAVTQSEVDESSLNDALNSLTVNDNVTSEAENVNNTTMSVEAELPQANVLFASSPEIPFPVGLDSFSPTKAQMDDLSPVNSSYLTPDPIRDAWIPTEETRKLLVSITTSSTNSFIPERSQVTMPGIVMEQDLVDRVALNMARIYGEMEASKRRILNADNVSQDDSGLRELIKLGCFRSAVNLTKRLLTLYGQGPGKIGQFSKHTLHSLQLWYTRITLLVKLNEFTTAYEEVKPFHNFEKADMYYEFYPEYNLQGHHGSMVPFFFRLIAAEVPLYAKKPNETIDALTYILFLIQQIIENVEDGKREDGHPVKLEDRRKAQSLKIWKGREIRVLYSLANASVASKDFNGAVLYLGKLLKKDTKQKMQLTSALGRIYLQYGDLKSAQHYFTASSQLVNQSLDSEKVDALTDSALLAIANGHYKQAYESLRKALAIQPENHMVANNMAVCLVYMGKVKEALSLMDSTVKQNCPQLLQENVIRNLSTVYELENSDGSRKNALLKLISEYKGDGIDLGALKMPNLI